MGATCDAWGEIHITGIWWVNLKKRNFLEYQCAEMRIILKWVLKKWDGKAWTEFIWLGKTKSVGNES